MITSHKVNNFYQNHEKLNHLTKDAIFVSLTTRIKNNKT